jgi:DNA-binding NarL/FixJ family response regulator
VVVLSADTEFENSVRTTFGASSAIELRMVSGSLAEHVDSLDVTDATVAVVDLDARRPDEMEALARLMARVGNWPPIIVITQTFDANVARTLLQMRTADFLVKPVAPIDLVRACARVRDGSAADRGKDLHVFAGGWRGRRYDPRRSNRHDSAQQRAARKAVDLSGGSRFSARLRRRLSRSRASSQSSRN